MDTPNKETPAPGYKPLRQIVAEQQREIEALRLRVLMLETKTTIDTIKLGNSILTLSEIVGYLVAEKASNVSIPQSGIDAALSGRSGPDGKRTPL